MYAGVHVMQVTAMLLLQHTSGHTPASAAAQGANVCVEWLNCSSNILSEGLAIPCVQPQQHGQYATWHQASGGHVRASA